MPIKSIWTNWVQWLISVIPATWEAEIRRIAVGGHPRHIVQETPIPKITRAKWTEGMAQVVEHLLCKCKALSSNSSHTKKKKKVYGQKSVHLC
jgi:hypothetical protein